MGKEMILSNWEVLLGTIFIAAMFYLSLIIILRISGKRTFLDINGFSLLIPVIIGPISASTILSSEVSFLNGLVAIITLIILQYIIIKLDTKFKIIGRLFISDPILLYCKGHFLRENMNKARITEGDIEQQVRLKAGTFIENISAAILESNGEISIIENASEEQIARLKRMTT